MRDIIFRGKKLSNEEWVEGYYLKSPEFDTKGVAVITTDFPRHPHFVKKDTIGQYTGLKDKNGKMIFEGDIIAGAVHWLERMKNGVVAFRCGSFGLIWHRGDVEQFNPFTSMCNVEYEVTGTIHDNPELIGGDSDA